MSLKDKISIGAFYNKITDGYDINNVIVTHAEYTPQRDIRCNSKMISNIEFECDIAFRVTNFSEAITFKNCVFKKNIVFNNSTFEKGVIFDNCTFWNDFEAKKIICNSKCTFNKVVFKESINLNNSTFQPSEVNRTYVVFSECIFGQKGKFGSEYLFENAKFKNNLIVEYNNCIFNSVLSFKKCELSRALYFNYCTFHKTPNMSGTDFTNGIDFFDSKFNKKYNSQDAGLFYREMKTYMKNSGNMPLAYQFHSLDQNNIRRLKIITTKKTKFFMWRYIKQIGNYLSINSLYHLFSDYSYSVLRPIVGLFFASGLYYLYILSSGVITMLEYASTAWQKELCLSNLLVNTVSEVQSIGCNSYIISLLLMVKPIIAPIYKIKFIEPNSGLGLFFQVLYFLF